MIKLSLALEWGKSLYCQNGQELDLLHVPFGAATWQMLANVLFSIE